MCNNENQKNSCIYDILKKILLLQKQDINNECYTGCDKPYLGPICNKTCYNTRPLNLYNCATGKPWTFHFMIDGIEKETDILRIEALNDNCCTCRLLYMDECTKQITPTKEFVTIDLNCVGAIKCNPDIEIDLC